MKFCACPCDVFHIFNKEIAWFSMQNFGTFWKISKSVLIKWIYRILSHESYEILQYILMEENQSVDYLVKLVFARKEGLQLLRPYILAFLKKDKERIFLFSSFFFLFFFINYKRKTNP